MNPGSNDQPELSSMVLPAALKQYELTSFISQDNTVQVFAAWDTQLCRPVWIRCIDHQGKNTEQILKEARLAAALKHAAFAKVHALEEVDEQLFIVSEAIVGTPLMDWILQHQGKEKAILEHSLQIASALAEAHQLGLVHGDIQANQFVIDASNKIRVLNCGFVSSRSSYMLSSIDHIDVRGGIAYLAPERFANAPATPASDVYALGTLLYQMLNGSLPFAHLQGLAMVAALVQSDAEQWPCRNELSPALRNWMLAMLKRQPEQRPSCTQLVEQGRALCAPENYSGSNSAIDLQGLKDQLARAQRRQKIYQIVAITLVVMLFAGGVWQAKPYWPQVIKVLTPYSASREIEQGAASLLDFVQSPLSSRLDRANEHFSRVLERQPEHAEAVGYMALVYLLRYQSAKRDEIWMQKAKASTQQALKLNPDLAITQIANARILQWHHKLELGLDAINRALVLAPDDLLAWQTKMSILLELGRKVEAIQFADAGAIRFSQDRYLLDLKAGILASENKFSEAEAALRVSLQRQPEGPLVYSLMAVVLEAQDRSDEALQFIQKGLEVIPSANLYEALGEARFAKGDYVAAAAAFENAASPEKGITGSYIRWSILAETLMWIPGREAEGIEAFKKAKSLLELRLNRSPDDAYLLAQMSRILARLGKENEALDLAKRAITLGPNDVDRLFLAAMTFELVGNRSLALETINKARRLGLPLKKILRNPVFNSLKNDPGFQQDALAPSVK